MADLIAALADEGIRHRDLRYGAGSSSKIPCPRARNCGAKNPADPCLSVSIDGDGEGATWNCHRGSCGGWTDGIRIKRDPDGFAKRETRVFRRPKPVEKAEQPDTMLEWFAKRGIDADTVKRNRIYRTTHWFPSMKEGEPEGGVMLPCIAFPYYRDGVLVNVKYRSADKRFLQEKDAEKTLYGIDNIGELDWCVLVEGEMDCLALEMAGFTNALSVPDGAPERISEVWACPDQKCTHSEKKRSKDTVAPLCPKHKRKMEAQGAPFDPADDRKFEYIWNCWDVLERMKKIILAVDDDAPGRALAEELSRRLGRERCWQVAWPKIELVGDIEVKADANAVLVHLGEDAVFNAITNAKPWPVEDIYTAGSYLDAVLRVYRGEISKGETTGFANLDEYFRLTGDGKLVIVTGIPAHGKSEFFDQLAINYATNHGWSTAYCSFENPPELHIPKLLEKRLEMPFHDGGTRARMGEGDLIKGMEWLDRYFTFMQTTDASPTLDWILDKAKTAVIRHGIRLLIIDPYNRIEHQRPHGTTETEYIAQMLDRLQRFGRSHGCDVIFIAHPRKLERTSDGTEPIPTPYDISGAAHFFNMADWCITVWRDRQNEYAPVQVHVKKVKWKHLGKEGFAEFVYDRTTGVYASAA